MNQSEIWIHKETKAEVEVLGYIGDNEEYVQLLLPNGMFSLIITEQFKKEFNPKN